MNIPFLKLQAQSLNLPAVADHPNRMGFSGCLVVCNQASDRAPHGSNGKRILLSRSAAEAALPSLLSMGINVAAGMSDHAPQKKIGVITEARLDGDALMVSGIIYSSDFPAAAAEIKRDQADLGFSFEARDISVQSMAAEILTITGLSFTGASVLLKSAAAYGCTSIAASADRPVTIVVEPVLAKALRSARIFQAGDGLRLSATQYDALLAGRDVHDRIQLKSLCALARITPAAAA